MGRHFKMKYRNNYFMAIKVNVLNFLFIKINFKFISRINILTKVYHIFTATWSNHTLQWNMIQSMQKTTNSLYIEDIFPLFIRERDSLYSLEHVLAYPWAAHWAVCVWNICLSLSVIFHKSVLHYDAFSKVYELPRKIQASCSS